MNYSISIDQAIVSSGISELIVLQICYCQRDTPSLRGLGPD